MNSLPTVQDSQIAAPVGSLELLRDLIHARSGIHFHDGHLDLMFDKLRPLILKKGFRSVLDYYYLLKEQPHYFEDWRRLMDTLSVQETYFWREMDQIRALVNVIVPQWFSKSRELLRIWIAACSSGEEAFTIAIALEEAGFSRFPIQIVASDASEAALEKARTGLFRERSFRVLPPEIRDKYFRQSRDRWLVNPQIMSRIRFERVNLVVKAETAELARSPVILCRNVFIYFSQEVIRQVVRHFAEQMPAGGYLFVGISESLLKLTNDFDLVEVGGSFVYVRKPQLTAMAP
ncbi:MAG: protein-glutamate O-methyltransferase CheR [Verrucomicrobia bacterium]|nr:protein-glutamate O-methyltransferase CheR [Verrucomicrobiota bacterium]